MYEPSYDIPQPQEDEDVLEAPTPFPSGACCPCPQSLSSGGRASVEIMLINGVMFEVAGTLGELKIVLQDAIDENEFAEVLVKNLAKGGVWTPYLLNPDHVMLAGSESFEEPPLTDKEGNVISFSPSSLKH